LKEGSAMMSYSSAGNLGDKHIAGIWLA
jgi:hypothetical protein